ncbi:carotenoid biosynthesis protein [Metabacillus sp. GX 13764]|uniref:carotenoid biosynthesis protein n=1 Tax=Metabacillus kandeliae TaxID=2900151 RepID=UPI001E41131A|nr:carotenoid biosynthesis protein [Metabacillus kandeliae]MCD7034916.1 carotenoid biosynthesis protein [Metabacillus kandeliae]
MKASQLLYYFFFVWYACGLVLLSLDILPPALEWANVVFLILAGSLGGIYLAEAYGVKKGIFLSLMIIIFSIFAEHLGVKYGILFGDYYYTKDFGPQAAGVPIVIGFAWLMVTAGSHAISKAIFKSAAGCIVFASMLAVLMDAILDPVAFKVKEYWVWEHKGPYYDIPFSNFLGWLIVSLVLHSLLYITVRGKMTIRPASVWEGRAVLVYYLVLFMFILLAVLNSLWLASAIVLLPAVFVLILYFHRKKRAAL